MADVPATDREPSPMDGRNCHVIKFVYSEAVRQALLDRCHMTNERHFRITAGTRKDSGFKMPEVEIYNLYDIYMYITTERKTTLRSDMTSSKRSQRDVVTRKQEVAGGHVTTRYRKRDANDKRKRDKQAEVLNRKSTTRG